jgi:hypothetical protein
MIGFIDTFVTISLNHNQLTITHNKSSAEPFFLDCRRLAPFSFSFYDWLLSQSQRVRVTLQLAVYRQSVRLGDKTLRLTTSNFIFQLNTCSYSLYVIFSLTKGSVCRSQLLLVFDSAVILKSESCWNNDHILLFQIRDSTNLEGQVHMFISPRVAQLHPKHWIPFSTTSRATVEVFEPASTRVNSLLLSRAKQSSSLLPATSQHGHSWHRAPLGPMAIYLFNVKTFVILFLLSLFLLS